MRKLGQWLHQTPVMIAIAIAAMALSWLLINDRDILITANIIIVCSFGIQILKNVACKNSNKQS